MWIILFNCLDTQARLLLYGYKHLHCVSLYILKSVALLDLLFFLSDRFLFTTEISAQHQHTHVNIQLSNQAAFRLYLVWTCPTWTIYLGCTIILNITEIAICPSAISKSQQSICNCWNIKCLTQHCNGVLYCFRDSMMHNAHCSPDVRKHFWFGTDSWSCFHLVSLCVSVCVS